MNRARVFVIGAAIFSLFAYVAAAQDLSRYRAFVLESSMESVVGSSGGRATDARTLHERPAKIQELEWWAPYASGELADPVRQIAFRFYNDALYQVIVSYDPDRTDGLTDRDLIATLTSAYGAPVPRSAKRQAIRPAGAYVDAVVLAHWETAAASLSLVRGAYMPEFQLILVSKSLSLSARNATREAVRLDAAEAPRRESEQRKKDAAEASATRLKARDANKAAFRP
jgi:hypothetical protein